LILRGDKNRRVADLKETGNSFNSEKNQETMIFRPKKILAAAIFYAPAFPFSVLAAVANVSVINNAFVPATTNISANESVDLDMAAAPYITTFTAQHSAGVDGFSHS